MLLDINRRPENLTRPSYIHNNRRPLSLKSQVHNKPIVSIPVLPRPRKYPKCFDFEKLPPELGIIVISFTSGMTAFRALLLVSKRTHDLAKAVYLPRTPVMLDTREQVTSFLSMVRAPYGGASYVRQLWIVPSVSAAEDVSMCAQIIRACINLVNLACRAKPLQAAILFVTPFLHTHLRRLTIMDGINSFSKVPALRQKSGSIIESDHPNGSDQLIGQITHLRSPLLPIPPPQQQSCFHRLTHWSYKGDRGSLNCGAYIPGQMPALEDVAVTVPCDSWLQYSEQETSGQCIMSPKVTDPRLRFIPFPKKVKESMAWLEDAEGKGRLWGQDPGSKNVVG